MSTTETETPTKTTAEDFREEWIAMRQSGHSYRQIGEKYGYSHERVRQQIGSDPRTERRRPSTVRRMQMGNDVREYLERVGPTPRDELLAELGINQRQLAYITAHDPTFPRHLIIMARRDTTEQYSDADIADAMRRAWDQSGREGLSHVLYDQYRQVDTDPSPARIIGRYHSWKAACVAAGVPDGGSRRAEESYVSAWTDEAIMAVMRRYIADMTAAGKRSTYIAYDQWQREHDDAPSGTTMRNRMKATGLTTWPDIVEAAMAGPGVE